jgi:hypothetical protein
MVCSTQPSIPFWYKKERTINICNSMDESQKNYAGIKKTDSDPPPKKMFILYDFSFMKLKNEQN